MSKKTIDTTETNVSNKNVNENESIKDSISDDPQRLYLEKTITDLLNTGVAAILRLSFPYFDGPLSLVDDLKKLDVKDEQIEMLQTFINWFGNLLSLYINAILRTYLGLPVEEVCNLQDDVIEETRKVFYNPEEPYFFDEIEEDEDGWPIEDEDYDENEYRPETMEHFADRCYDHLAERLDNNLELRRAVLIREAFKGLNEDEQETIIKFLNKYGVII